MQANVFQIKTFKNPSGAEVFRVTGWLNGKRIRENHPTNAIALSAKQDYERQAANMAPLPAVTTRLSSDQAAEAEACYRRITGKPFTLTQAVEFALANLSQPEKTMTVNDAVPLFIKSKKDGNRRERTLQNLGSRLNGLKTDHGKSLVNEILPATLKALIFRDGSSLINQKNDYAVFTNFFNWAVKNGYSEKNPMSKIDEITVDQAEPEILSLAEVRKFVATAQAYKDGVMVPYLTLALFCAIRPTEIAGLTWNKIDLENKTVTIGADIAKCRGRRTVEIPDNAVDFLLTHQLEKTPLVGENWRRDFEAVKLAVGFGTYDDEHNDHKLAKCHCKKCCTLKEWTQDALRHTGISYHLPTHDEGKTAAWAGNSPDVIHRHYKGLVKKQEVAEFWNIRPGTVGKIIDLKMAV